METLLAWKICFVAGIPDCRIASGSQMCSSAGGWTLSGTAEITSSPFPLQQGQPGASQPVGQFGIWHPKADYLWLAGAGLLLPKPGEQRERLCWGRHPRANFEPPAASKGSRSKKQLEEWVMTVSVSVGLISRTWNLSNVQPECLCYYCLICMLSVTECS